MVTWSDLAMVSGRQADIDRATVDETEKRREVKEENRPLARGQRKVPRYNKKNDVW